MQLRINIAKNITNGSLEVQCVLTESSLEEIMIFNEFSVSYHFGEFKKALEKATKRINDPSPVIPPSLDEPLLK